MYMIEPSYKIVDGVGFYDEPYIVKWEDWSKNHPFCDCIFEDVESSPLDMRIICFAVDEKYNYMLEDVCNSGKYPDAGISKAVSSEEVDSID